MSHAATLVGVLKTSVLPEVAEKYHWCEVRADLVPDPDPSRVRSAAGSGVRLLYTLKSQEEGGQSRLACAERHQRLRAAAASYDFVSLEGERDLVPALLQAIPPERRVISWTGPSVSHDHLHGQFANYGREAARLYRFELACMGAEEALPALQFLHALGRKDVIAYGQGACGSWTRVLAPRLGAPVVFATLARDDSDGEPTLAQVTEDYGFPELPAIQEIFGIIGDPVSGSLSPLLHNKAYRAASARRLFLSFPSKNFQRFWDTVVASNALGGMGFSLLGLTVASPHKEAVLKVAQHRALLCREATASNLLIRKESEWRAETSDPESVFHGGAGLAKRDSQVAVIGCGGSGRVIAAAFKRRGAKVTLVNRSCERGQWAGALLGLPFVPLEHFCPAKYDTLVNATPVGRRGEQLPIELNRLPGDATVVDLVYRPGGETPLVSEARRLGRRVTEGRMVLLAQTQRQYYRMTGEKMPASLGRRLLGLEPDDSGNPTRSRQHATAA